MTDGQTIIPACTGGAFVARADKRQTPVNQTGPEVWRASARCLAGRQTPCLYWVKRLSGGLSLGRAGYVATLYGKTGPLRVLPGGVLTRVRD